jgi:protoporphyrinogen/coproporphyrinogen III oxidase
MQPLSIAVVGGGAAGLAAAYYLRRQGHRVELIEKGACLGGRMTTATLGARKIALGGKNIGRRYTLFREFVRDMGDQPFEYFGLNSSRIRDGRIVTLDGERRWAGMMRVLRTCTLRDVLRAAPMVAAIRRDRRNAFLGGPFFTALEARRENDSPASYFSRSFCEQVVRPMSVRMNGAEPSQIALGNFGTNLCMIFDTYEQLRDGFDPLFDRFAQTGPLRLGSTVESLIVRRGRVAGLRVRDECGVEELAYDQVVLAMPARQAAELLRPHSIELAALLGAIKYFPVGVVVAEYDRPIFNRDVRALVFPEDQPLSNAGVYGLEERHIVRYTFSGGVAQAMLQDEPRPERMLDEAERILARYVPVSRHERVSFVGKVMPIGLCAYTGGHARFAKGVESVLRRLPGLELTGDYLQGASIEACFRSSLACADRIRRAADA